MSGMAAVTVSSGGLQVWGVSPIRKVYGDDTPTTVRPRPLALLAARGEVRGLQLALRAAAPRAEVRIHCAALRSADGAALAAPLVRWVDHVPVEHFTFTHADDIPDIERPAPERYPDPLTEREAGHLEPEQTRSIYLTFTVGTDLPAGTFAGRVRVTTPTDVCELPVAIEVADCRISPATHLQMTNWPMDPKSQARFFGYPVGCRRYWTYVEAMARDMVAHRSTVFLAPYYDLVRGELDRQGRITWDFADFDRYVETFLRCGADLIEGQHLLVRVSQDRSLLGLQTRGDLHIRFRGDDAYHRPYPQTPARPVLGGALFEERVGSLLQALHAHLIRKGWKDRFVLHVMDEPGNDYADLYRQARAFVHQHMPGVSTVDASQTMDLELDLRDRYVPLLHAWNDTFRQRQQQGARDWWYVCWGPRFGGYPNRFIDYPLIDSRLLLWLTYREGVSGFLHWGYNKYFHNLYYIPEPRDPFLEPDVGFTAPGDSMVVYPGEADSIVSSLRWEQTLEGQQDCEHLRRLAELSGEGPTSGLTGAVLDECCPSLTTGTRDPQVLLSGRDRILREIVRLEQA
jgi:hypothetical protein